MRALFRAVILGASLLATGGSALASSGSGSGDDDIFEPEDVALEDPADFEAPDAPDIDTPDIDTPEIDAPEIDAPESDLSESDTAEFDTPEAEEPTLDTSENDEPETETPDDVELEESSDDKSGAGSGDDDLEDLTDDDNGGSGSGDNSGSGHGGGHDDDDGDDTASGSGGRGSDQSLNAQSENSGRSGNSGGGSSGRSENASARASDLVQQHRSGPIEIDRDELGREHIAGEVLMVGAGADIVRATEAGYRLISEQAFGVEGRLLARLLAPDDLNLSQAIDALHQIAPTAIVTLNTAYRTTQATSFAPAAPSRGGRRLGRGHLGVIDTGADPAALASAEAMLASRGFGSSGYVARPHGSAVASIATRLGVRVSVADVFGPSTTGAPIASASAIAAALQWMMEAGVPVINISIEGPQNPLLERLIEEAVRHGHVIVAAAGNGGPLAEPAYPGAYAGVLAVTAVDRTGHAYFRANRGDYVDFAALGVDVPVRGSDGDATVSGTSFASPMVAAQIAARVLQPSPEHAARVIGELRQSAVDLGRPGRDPIYGWGEVRPE